jgi:hypothetical protein
VENHRWLNISVVQYKNNVPKENERKKRLEFNRTVADVAELYGRETKEMKKRSVCRQQK